MSKKSTLILTSLLLLASTGCQPKPITPAKSTVDNLAFLTEEVEPLTGYADQSSLPLFISNTNVPTTAMQSLAMQTQNIAEKPVSDTLLIHEILAASDTFTLPLQDIARTAAKTGALVKELPKRALVSDTKNYRHCEKTALLEKVEQAAPTYANISQSVAAIQEPQEDLMPAWSQQVSQTPLQQYPPKFIATSILHFMKENMLMHSLRDYNYHAVRAKEDLSSSLEINAYAHKIAQDSDEYVFFIEVKPTKQLEKSKLKQKYLLCIDQSNSVERKQFIYFKNALVKAFSYLPEGDLFNVALIDKDIKTLAKKFVEVTPDNLKKAEKFLDQLGLKKNSAANIYHTLASKLIIENDQDTNYHIILVTDGGLEDDLKMKKAIGQEILQTTQGKAKLHIATVGSGCEDRLISILSSLTGGKFVYSDTYTALPRKLGKLFIEIASPVATDVKIAFRSPGVTLESQEKISSIKTLCKDSSQCWIYKTTTLEPMQVIIQGYMGQEYFRAVKNIIPQEMQQPPAILNSAWKQLQAEEAFLQFIKSGDEKDLDRALAWIKKHSKT